MKDGIIFTAEGRISTKKERAKDCKKSANAALIPDSYKNNTTREELCLEYIHSFLEQYKELYPKRKQPYMIIENEYGIKKFICSAIRPTQLSYSELYDMYECSSFLAGYVLYEPLDSPTKPPKIIFSPTETLERNTGDCFDLSTLLCSLLIGSGYDAYVVSGHAPKFITLRDQTTTVCPMIPNNNDTFVKAKIKNEDENENVEKSTYIPLDNSVKSSFYIAEQLEKTRIGDLDTFELWTPDLLPMNNERNDSNNNDYDKIDGDPRQHAWVMVCSGRRDVKEALFFEPSTGRVHSTTTSPYLGVEAVWNHLNFYIPNSVGAKITDIDFDLSKAKNWESLFPSLLKSENRNSNSDDIITQISNNDHSNIIEDKIRSRPITARDVQNGVKPENTETGRIFENPPSWVSPISLGRNQYQMRYPPIGRRTVQYYCSKCDFFAKNIHPQCMVMRIISYLDKDRTVVKEIIEWFDNRKDKMFKRIRSFLEYYHPGSMGEVKQWTQHLGKRTEIDFYVQGRLDRLVRRVEIIGEKVVEIFEGRSDCLIYRSVLFTTDKYSVGSRQFPLPGNGLINDLYIVEMTQKYEINKIGLQEDSLSKKNNNLKNVAKRIFYVREGKLVAMYHFQKDQITYDIKTYLHSRGPGVLAMTEQAYAQELGVVEDLEALQEAAQLERECYSAIKASFQQLYKIDTHRKEFEINIVNEKTVFELALCKAEKTEFLKIDSSNGKNDNDSKGLNYLTPYLRNIKDPLSIAKEEAVEVKQNCLDALRARLIERANIIQSRLNDENAKLGREQERFQRSQREGDLTTEEYEKYCTEAMFRIQILEQRLASHEESALKKFSELDIRLSNDERLKVLK